MKNNIAFVILAAGKSRRMKGNISKVLYKVGGEPIILKTLKTLQKVGAGQIVVVVGYDRENVKKVIGKNVTYAYDEKQIGTGNAARIGIEKVKNSIDTVVVLNGDDSAFYKSETIEDVIKKHLSTKSVLTFVTLFPKDPTGLGRVVRNGKELVGVVEEKDATQSELKIKEVNDGLYVFDKSWAIKNFAKIKKSKFTGEYYLLDLIKEALLQNKKVSTYTLKDPNEWHGINTPEDLVAANKKQAKKIHIMGISGAGAAAVAGIAKSYGFEVSGCDINPQSPYSQNLNLEIKKGHSPSHLNGIDMLIMSPAILKFDSNNNEVQKAREKNIPVLTWQEFQGKFLHEDKFVITVAGAFGKSTTTTMISQILIDAKQDPTCEIGAKVIAWNSNYKIGKSKYYVCESDEYNDNFLNYNPNLAVILNMGWDHPDFFKNEKQLQDSYAKFANKIKDGGCLVTTEEVLKVIGKKIRKDIKIVKVENFGDIELSLVGNFRRQNAQAALTVAKILGINQQSANKTLKNFKGLGRRLEYKGSVEGVEFWDDYAVQPFTILKTANALKEKYPNKKVTLVLEPHTFTRINTFFADFEKSLKETKVDEVLVTNVFAAREKGDNEGLAKKLAQTTEGKTKYVGSIEEAAKTIKTNIKNYEVVLSMGAGNSYKLYNFVRNYMSKANTVL